MNAETLKRYAEYRRKELNKFDKAVGRCEWLVRHVKRIEYALIDWHKEHVYSQGDSYQAFVLDDGRWAVSYSNDYPLQHGSGQTHIFTPAEFKEATKGIERLT